MYDNLIISQQLRQIVERIEEVLTSSKLDIGAALIQKVDKIPGKGLSTEDFTTAEKTKLSGVESGAQVNVQSDWNISDSTSDAYIKNKPSLSGYFDAVDYNSTDKRIYFKHGANILGSVDTSDFVKDGMVTSAEIRKPATGPNANKNCLIITFNSDSEIEPIEIPLELIFNPDNYYTKVESDNKFVEKETGKGLSTNDYTTDEKNKLAGIETGAEVNVNADWEAASGDAQILNKPTTLSGYGITDAKIEDVENEEFKKKITLGENITEVVTDVSRKADKLYTVTDVSYSNKTFKQTINEISNDIVTIADIKSDLDLVKSDVGLSNVDNTADIDKPISTLTQNALNDKVDKVPGKALSDKNFTAAYEAKLNGIETGAQVNVIETISVNNQNISPLNKNINITVPSVDSYFDGVAYDSNTKKINFKHSGNTLVELDATPFIKDGMVNSVDIVGGNLEITFNSDAGKETISIDLDEIFNPNNYYTISEINDNFVAKSETKDLSTNDYTDEDKDKLDNIAAGAQVNVIEKIQKNGIDLTVENKTVNITIPTNVSEFNNDANYLTEHQDISGKANLSDLANVATSGDFMDLINKPGITAGRYQGEYNTYANIPSNKDDYEVGIPLDGDYLLVNNSSDYPNVSGRWMFRFVGTWNVSGKNGWKPLFSLGIVEIKTINSQSLIGSGDIITASVENDDTLVL